MSVLAHFDWFWVNWTYGVGCPQPPQSQQFWQISMTWGEEIQIINCPQMVWNKFWGYEAHFKKWCTPENDSEDLPILIFKGMTETNKSESTLPDSAKFEVEVLRTTIVVCMYVLYVTLHFSWVCPCQFRVSSPYHPFQIFEDAQQIQEIMPSIEKILSLRGGR